MARKSIYPPSVQPGIPKLGKLPPGWKLIPFRDLVKISSQPASLEDDKEYQLVTAKRSRGGIVPREKLLGENIKTKSQFYISAGDFLISRRQIVHGACGIVPPELDGSVVSNEYLALHPKEEVLQKYLACFSHSLYFQQTCFHSSIGVDVEKMVFKIEQWLKHKMPLPPIEEQKWIVEVLEAWDSAIALTGKLITTKQKLKKDILNALVTGKIRISGFEDSVWRKQYLHNVASVQTGISKGKKGLKKPVELPYLRVANVQDGHLDLNIIKKITVEEEQVNRYLLQKDDVLLTEGGDFDKLGRCCIWRGQIQRCVHQNHVFVVRANENILSPEFFSFQAESSYGKRYFLSCAKQTTNLASINSSQLKKFPLLLPPLIEQREIVSLLNSFAWEIESLKKKLALIQQQKKGLMQKLLTGEWRVPIEEVVA